MPFKSVRVPERGWVSFHFDSLLLTSGMVALVWWQMLEHGCCAWRKSRAEEEAGGETSTRSGKSFEGQLRMPSCAEGEVLTRILSMKSNVSLQDNVPHLFRQLVLSPKTCKSCWRHRCRAMLQNVSPTCFLT